MPGPRTHTTGLAAGAQAPAHDDTRLSPAWHDHVVRRPRADDGKLITRTEASHTHIEWLRFLKQIDRETPRGLDLYLIADNYAHPQISEREGLAGETSSLHDALYADLIVLAQSCRALLRRPDRRRNPRRQLRLGQRTHPRHQHLSGTAQR